MFFKQFDVAYSHAAVSSFAHIINRQQAHAHSGEGFHFHACLTCGFSGDVANNSVLKRLGFVIDFAAWPT
jgi:hypothetical protein